MTTPMLVEVVLRVAVPADGAEGAINAVRDMITKVQNAAERRYERMGPDSRSDVAYSMRPAVMRIGVVGEAREWLSMPWSTVSQPYSGRDLVRVLAGVDDV